MYNFELKLIFAVKLTKPKFYHCFDNFMEHNRKVKFLKCMEPRAVELKDMFICV